jgi:hypothetical protein
MPWIRTILAEIVGLFVDDARFAVAIVVWLGVSWLALSRLALPPTLAGMLFFAGLVIILIESAVRRAGKRSG